MNDDLDFEMEVVDTDELDELDGSGAQSSEGSFRSVGAEDTTQDLESEDLEGDKSQSMPGSEGITSEKVAPTINPNVEGWSHISLEYFASFQNGNAFSKSDWGEDGYPIIRIQNLTGEADAYNYYDGELEDRYQVEPGDTLLTWSGTIGVFKWEGPTAALNQHIFNVETSEEVNDSFFHFKLEELIPQLEALSHGSTMKHVRKADLVNIGIEIPPLPEQRKIASILYTVDQAIQKTEAIIEQAKRVKRGLVQDLLSLGIGENGQLRNSDRNPIDFQDTKLGQLPADWNVIPMGKAMSTLYRYPSYYDIDYVDDGVPEVRGELLQPDGSIKLETEEVRYISEETASEYPRVRLEENDFVVSVRGTVGKVGRIPPSLAGGVITANLIRIKFNSDLISPDYAQLIILSRQFQKRLDALTSATTIKTIKADDLRRIPIRLPDLTEQKRISEVVRSHTERIREEKAQLDEFRRLKKGLMQDLLTGEVRTADKAIDVLDEVVAHG